ncbi:hypothetical protein U0070_021282 [Myodes glareolus]|uniref:Uncharacterized protein n=1 Tax=Myodes glareolus TaxID=447135 RepID=A0AAW0JI32_MYOGA
MCSLQLEVFASHSPALCPDRPCGKGYPLLITLGIKVSSEGQDPLVPFLLPLPVSRAQQYHSTSEHTPAIPIARQNRECQKHGACRALSCVFP